MNCNKESSNTKLKELGEEKDEEEKQGYWCGREEGLPGSGRQRVSRRRWQLPQSVGQLCVRCRELKERLVIPQWSGVKSRPSRRIMPATGNNNITLWDIGGSQGFDFCAVIENESESEYLRDLKRYFLRYFDDTSRCKCSFFNLLSTIQVIHFLTFRKYKIIWH